MNSLATLLASLVLLAAPAMPAGGLQVAPGAKLWIDGDSTLHKYHVDAHNFDAVLTADPGGDLITQIKEKKVKKVELVVPVGSLSSGESGLDDNLKKALKSAVNPKITFSLSEYEVTPAKDPQATCGLLLHGTVTVAGVTHPIAVPVQAYLKGDKVELKGQVALTMSQFGVKAPVLFLGTIKTADAVTIGFDLTVQSGS